MIKLSVKLELWLMNSESKNEDAPNMSNGLFHFGELIP